MMILFFDMLERCALFVCQVIIFCSIANSRYSLRQSWTMLAAMITVCFVAYSFAVSYSGLEIPSASLQEAIFFIPFFFLGLRISLYGGWRYVFIYFFSDFSIKSFNSFCYLVMKLSDASEMLIFFTVSMIFSNVIFTIFFLCNLSKRIRAVLVFGESPSWAWMGMSAIMLSVAVLILPIKNEDGTVLRLCLFFNLIFFAVFLLQILTICKMHVLEGTKKRKMRYMDSIFMIRLDAKERISSYQSILNECNRVLAECDAVLIGLEKYSSGMPVEHYKVREKRYASDDDANTFFSYFARKADFRNIYYDAVCDIPGDIIEWDLGIFYLFSNALDNAVYAASRCQGKKRFVRLHAKLRGSSIYCRIANGFEGELKYDKEGRLISQKSDCSEYGIGYMSMEHVVREKGGFLHHENQCGIFSLEFSINCRIKEKACTPCIP